MYPDDPDADIVLPSLPLPKALERAGIRLPCEDGLRWRSEEDFAGSGGSLYLLLTPPEDCLRTLVTTLGGDPAQEQRSTGTEFRHTISTPDAVRWKFPPEHTYGWYQVPRRDQVQYQLVVDRSTTPITVYVHTIRV